MNDDETVRSTSVEQGCEISPTSALFLLNHFSFAWDNHVSQRSVKLMVNTSDSTSTMRIKEDQNKHLKWERTFARRCIVEPKKCRGRLCLLVISKKKSIIPRLLTYFF